MAKQSSNDRDNDHTDELPILLETVVFEDVALAPAPPEDTAQHAALYDAPRSEDSSPSAALRTDLAVRSAKIAELEAQIARFSERWSELERHLTDRETAIRDLNQQLTTSREAADASRTAERRLAAQVADRETRLADLATDRERLRRELEARATAAAETTAAAATAEARVRELEDQLAARPANDDHSAMQGLLEENAALTTYIAGRRTWWDRVEAERDALAARLAALEHDRRVEAARLKEAESLAARESERAKSLRTELVDHARRLEGTERELRLVRADPPAAALPPVPAPAPSPPTDPVRSVPASSSVPEPVSVAPPSADNAFEVVAQLEAEVEFKRQQVAAQIVELRDREHRLQMQTTELDRVRQELAALRTDLERSRADVTRLERAVLDKDRAIEARDNRIATLQDEINQRLGAVQKLNAIDLSLQGLDMKIAERLHSGGEPSADSTQGPALICLTGEAPKRFALNKKKITVGRGAHCDLQVLTHFVSREHARILVAGSTALIEDLGSRNGVFVNSVRIERQELQHGDLITIGETQFRFVESMAH